MTSHLSIIQEWQANCEEFSRNSDDIMVPSIMNALDVLRASTRLKYDQEQTERALLALHKELQQSIRKEKGKDSIRVLMFGLMESLHVSHRMLADQRKLQQRDLSAPRPRSVSVIDLDDEREPSAALSAADNDDGQSVIEIGVVNKQPEPAAAADAAVAASDHEPVVKRSKNKVVPAKAVEGKALAEITFSPVVKRNKKDVREKKEKERDEEMDVDVKEEEVESENTSAPTTPPPVLLDTPRPKRVSAQSIDFIALNGGGGVSRGKISCTNTTTPASTTPKMVDVKPVVRKSGGGGVVRGKTLGSTPLGRSGKKGVSLASVKKEAGGGVVKRSKMLKFKFKTNIFKPRSAAELAKRGIMKCMLCDRELTSVVSFVSHLAAAHQTTPTKERIWFRCDCGHMSRSNGHEVWKQPECGGRFSTIVRDEELSDEEEEEGEEDETELMADASSDDEEREVADSPECFLCDTHPSTLCGYTNHLKIYHQTTLLQQNRSLACRCGMRITSEHAVRRHNRTGKCAGKAFALRFAVASPKELKKEVKEEEEEEVKKEVKEEEVEEEEEPVKPGGEKAMDMDVKEEEEEKVELLGKDGWHPKCFLCEVRPATISDYIQHLRTAHNNATLTKFGYSLHCDCGRPILTQFGATAHENETKCDPRKFRLKKLGAADEEEKQKKMAEARAPPTPSGPPKTPSVSSSLASFSL